MILETQHADDAQLHTLLFDDESSTETSTIAAHVEECMVCQSRLRNIVATEDEESETRLLLSGHTRRDDASAKPTIPQMATQTSGDVSAPHANRRVYSSLSPPSHPEMLGRLGRYEIEREIGSGGMGVVFKGWDSELNRPVAIKVLAEHLARSGAARQRFGRESRAAAAVVHEHVVAIHNVESDGETPFLVMQYVAGESLQARIDRVGPLGVTEVLRIGIQTASGLAAAHEQGIIHRDIKPANILLEHGVERVLLTDFGLARTTDDASLTQTGIVAGTPQYMSPEQANGDVADCRADLFSLGSVLYFIATGHPPFRAERAMGILHRICNDQQRPAWQVNSAISDELSDIIDRLLEKRPSRRFASAIAARDAMVRLLNETQQRRPSAKSVARRWMRRRSNWIVAGSFGIAALLAGVAWWAPSLSQTGLQESNSATPGITLNAASSSESVLPQVLALIDPNDSAQFDKTIEKLHEQLRQIGNSDMNSPDAQSLSRWDDELRSMHQRLDQLE